MELIEINSDKMFGKPVIAGTRITVEQILEEFSAGKGYEELLTAHPHINKNQIQAALQFAKDAGRSRP